MWEDTLMDDVEMARVLNELPIIAGGRRQGNLLRTWRKLAEAQAEISYKAGREDERRDLNYCEEHKLYYCDCCPDCFKKVGIRELVKILDLHEDEIGFCEISNHIPYEPLKELGVGT